jgi:uncharacterized protein (DUF1501 family)
MTDHAPHEPHGRNLLGRRALLQLAGAAGIATTTSLAGARFAFGAPGDGDVLVVLSLRGGFDGLAAVAPVGDPEWTKLRPNIGTPERAVKRVDDVFGLHPAMSPLFGAWTEGELAVVHAVGQPSDSRSHAVATAELERAAPALPAAMTGPRAELSVGRLANQQLAVKEEVVPLAAWQRAFDELNVNARPQIARPTEWALDGVAALRPLATQTTGSAGSVPYPEGQLGETLADLARLVRARSGVNVATVDVDGWDLHADAGRFDGGRMRDRLRELSQGMAAFRDDLGADFGRVTVVTLSEFGRRAAENGSGGTDHGHGNAVLVFGGAVRGGRVYGRWPGLAADRLADGDLAATTDYRSILAEVLGSRLGVSASSVFPGFKPASLGVVKPR